MEYICEDCETKLTEEEIRSHEAHAEDCIHWGIEASCWCSNCGEERYNAQFEEL